MGKSQLTKKEPPFVSTDKRATGIDNSERIRAGYPNRIAINRDKRWFGMLGIIGRKALNIK
jgi:hypothetical protein